MDNLPTSVSDLATMKSPRTSSRTNPSATTSGSKKSKTLSSTAKNPTKRGVSASPARSIASPAAKKKTPAKAATPSRASRSSSLPSRQTPQKTPVRASSPRASAKKEKSQVKSSPASSQKKSVKEVKEQSKEKTTTKKDIKEPSKKLSVKKKESSSKEDLPGRQTNANKDTQKNTAKQGQGKQVAAKEKAEKSESRSSRSRNRKSPTPEDREDSSSEEETVVRRRSSKSSQKDNAEKSKPKVQEKVLKSKIDSKSAKSNSDRQSEVDESDESEEEEVKAAPKGRRLSSRSNQKNGNGDSQTPEKKNEAKAAEKKNEAKVGEKKNDAKAAEKKTEAKAVEKKNEGQTAGKKNGVKNTETINEDEANTAEKKNETKTTDSNSNVEATSDETAMVIDDEAKKATKPVSVHILKLNATELGAMVRTDVNAKQIEITESEEDDDDDIISEGSVVELDDSSEGSVEEISSDDYVSSGEDDVVFSEDEIDPRQFVHVRILNQKLETMEVNHAMQLKKKNEALERLKNELKWKEEQLSEMNNITVKNIELESKISAMLSDSKIYQEEVTKWKETNRSKDEEVAKNSVKSKDIAEKVVKSKEVVKSKAVAEKSVKSKEVAEKTVKSKEVAEKVDNSKEVPEKSVKKKSEGKETEKEDKVKQTKQKEKSEVKEKKVEKKADRASSRKRQRKESSSNEESANEEEMETEVETRSSPRKKDAKGKGKQETPKKVAKSKEDKQKKKGKGAEDSQKKEEKREATPRRRSRRNKEENESDKESDTKEQSEESEDEEEKSEKDGKKKSRKRKRSTPARKGKKGKRRRKKKSEEDESSEEEEDIDELFVSKKDEEEDSDIQIIEDSDAEDKGKKNKSPKKKTVSKDDVKDDEDKGEEEEDEDDDDDDKDGKGRHNIRKLLTGKKLTEETKAAAKAEKDRRERALKEHDKHLVVQEEDPNSPHKICTKLVLSFKEGTKQPLVEVLPKLVKKLKPHQVEAVEFMWDNLVESVDKLKAGHPGQGCILAHCMGLGKTLSVITLVHTMLKSKAVGLKCCMVVCPLNTVLNWQFEWTKWLDKKERVPTYELASCKGNHDRAELLNKWKKSGGIMIIGYSLFRILASYTGKSKKVKAAFDAGLLDPGPDIVICDEGHILKNDASALSKWMSKIKSQRRVVLTGTPLQNNLVEYHCMTNFVKPQLLGTRKEFCNRFVNPITNGQHSDSTSQDVKLMKRRAHVLHEMLAGCVQRRDYSALTKFLPSKNEYVISVRLSKLQIELYQKYLDTFRAEESKAANQTFEQFKIRGASLFTDYQALMRVWTHPWVLKLDAQRQEKKAFNEQDDELDSLDEESDLSLSESEEESVSKDSDSEEDMDVDGSTSDSNSSGGKRKTRGKKTEAKKSKGKDKPKEKSRSNRAKSRRGVSNDDDDSSKNTTETESNGTSELEEKAKVLAGEVIRTWKTTSRHGKQDAVNQDDLVRKDHQWWTDLVDEEKYKKAVEVSGKLVLLFEVLRMAEGLGDKVLVFSQSILSLDLIEEFLKYKTEEAEKYKGKKADKPSKWIKDEDYYRMDGTTGAQNRRKFTSSFNTDDNDRLRLFLISTRAGGLGINLDSANRVIIFDASWNPSHDIQSIFRVYRFGQKKPVQVYRFVAQGTMEEKIYERQVAKETLSQRVIDEHQIDRHFTANDLKELYIFKPDRLDDPERIEPPVPKVPSDLILAELLTEQKDWIYGYHEHDSLLENRPDENLSEEERKAAWADYERDKQGLYNYSSYTNTAQQQPATNLMYRAPILNSYLTGPHLRPQGFTSTYTQPQINMQLQQLPRVVKEILKYNPNITAGDLQNRLQSFLGMHGKFAIPPGPGGTAGQPIRITTLPSASNSASGSRSNTPPVINMALPQALPAQGFWPTTSARPAQGFMSTSAKPAQGFMSSVPRLVQASFQPPPSIPTLFPGSLPSRLPNTGRVPAMHPIPGTSSGASTPPGTGASSLGAGDSSSKPAAAAATSSAT